MQFKNHCVQGLGGDHFHDVADIAALHLEQSVKTGREDAHDQILIGHASFLQAQVDDADDVLFWLFQVGLGVDLQEVEIPIDILPDIQPDQGREAKAGIDVPGQILKPFLEIGILLS